MKIIEQSKNLNLDEFMKQPLFAHLATLSESGPANSPIWCLWKDNYLWICTDIVNQPMMLKHKYLLKPLKVYFQDTKARIMETHYE